MTQIALFQRSQTAPYDWLRLESPEPNFSHQEVVVEDDREKLNDALTRAVGSGGEYQVTYRLRSPDGTIRAVLERGWPSAEGFLQGVLSDTGLRSAFVSKLSHDLRTPMSLILGYVHVARAAEADQLQGWLDRIERASQDLLLRLEDRVDAARLAAQEIQVHPESFSLKPWLDEITQSAQDLRLSYELHEDVEPTWTSDPQRLKQLVLKMVRRAARNSPDGALVLKLAPYRGSGLAISVSGLSLESDPDWSLLQGLCHLLGGELTANGMLLSAPRADSMPLAARAVRSLVGLNPASVLIAEDQPLNAELLTDMLQSRGVRCKVAGDGAAVLKLYESESFDLILMDVQMPVMDGLEATRELRRRGSQTPIVALTASHMPEDTRRCLDAGMDAFLTKPIQPQQLDRILGKESPEAANADMVIDFDRGVERLGGRRRRFHLLLQQFADKHADTAQELERLTREGDREGVIRKVHAVRGVAANLGARALADSARAAEDLMRQSEGNWAEGELAAFLAELHRVVQTIRDLPAPPDEPPPVPRAELQEKLHRLEAALNRDVSEALQLADELANLKMDGLLGHGLSALQAALHAFEMDHAADLVRSCIEETQRDL